VPIVDVEPLTRVGLCCKETQVTQTRKQKVWTDLEHALEDAGIDRAEFAKLALRAVEGALRSPVREDPASAFTADEAAVLREGGFDLSPPRHGEPDVVAQTAAGLALIEATSATVGEVAQKLRVTASRVRQRAVERSLYGLREEDEWRFPRWQFGEDGRPIRGLAQVFAALPQGVHPVAVWRLVSEPSPDLEILDKLASPLEWLRSGGDPGPVAAIAREL
jgi:hypothetical protein